MRAVDLIQKKKEGFELHHVVPLCWAKNEIEFSTLDNWQNLVYIDAYSHAKITQNNNRNVVLGFIDDDACFKDFVGKSIICSFGNQISYSVVDKPKMLAYNNVLLNGLNTENITSTHPESNLYIAGTIIEHKHFGAGIIKDLQNER